MNDQLATVGGDLGVRLSHRLLAVDEGQMNSADADSTISPGHNDRAVTNGQDKNTGADRGCSGPATRTAPGRATLGAPGLSPSVAVTSANPHTPHGQTGHVIIDDQLNCAMGSNSFPSGHRTTAVEDGQRGRAAGEVTFCAGQPPPANNDQGQCALASTDPRVPPGQFPIAADGHRPGAGAASPITTSPTCGHALDADNGHKPRTAGGPVILPGQSDFATDDGQVVHAGEDRGRPGPAQLGMGLDDPRLNLAAEVLDDLEKVRISNENRLRQLTRDPDQLDKDGQRRGFGLTPADPGVMRLALIVQAMLCNSKVVLELGFPAKPKTKGCCLEHDAERALTALLKEHPLGPWVLSRKGVGEKQAARLLAAIGDPAWHPLHDRVRTEAELWSYCGYGLVDVPSGQAQYADMNGQTISTAGDLNGSGPGQSATAVTNGHAGRARVAPFPQRGVKVNWSPAARMRSFNVIDSCLKQLRAPCYVVKEGTRYVEAVHVEGCACSPYRVRYDNYRKVHRDAVHASLCRRCGPKGKPAEVGSALSDGHRHQRAARAATKKMLRHLRWEALRLHGLPIS